MYKIIKHNKRGSRIYKDYYNADYLHIKWIVWREPTIWDMVWYWRNINLIRISKQYWKKDIRRYIRKENQTKWILDLFK